MATSLVTAFHQGAERDMIDRLIDHLDVQEAAAPAVAVAKQLAERSGVWRNAGHPHAFSVRHFEALVEDRKKARENKDWSKADEIRDELSAIGVELLDGHARGWKVKVSEA